MSNKIIKKSVASFVCLTVFVSCFFCSCKKEKKQPEPEKQTAGNIVDSGNEELWGEDLGEPDVESYNNIQYLKITSFEDLQKIATEKENFVMILNESTHAINDLLIDGKTVNITYLHNDNSLYMVRWSYEMCSSVQSYDAEQLEYDIAQILYLFKVIFQENIESVNIYSLDGFPLEVSAEAYNKILVGEAIFDLTIQDREGTLWNARTHLSDEGVLSVKFYHSLEKNTEKKIIPDVILE